MSMHKATVAPGQHLCSVHMEARWQGGLGPVHVILGQLTDPRVNALSDACNCSHEFYVAPRQVREVGYPLCNTG